MKYELTAKRLIEAMNDIGINQRDLSIKADIKEASVSHYVNGTHKPGNINAIKMGDVLHVNWVWLMGHDVPKYPADERIDLTKLNSEQYQKLKSYYDFLLREGDK